MYYKKRQSSRTALFIVESIDASALRAGNGLGMALQLIEITYDGPGYAQDRAAKASVRSVQAAETTRRSSGAVMPWTSPTSPVSHASCSVGVRSLAVPPPGPSEPLDSHVE